MALEVGTVDGVWKSPNTFLRRKARRFTVVAGDFVDIDHDTNKMRK